MGSSKRPRQGEKIVKATWVAQAVKLATEGWSTRRIGAKVNRHHATVAEALNAEFARVRPSEEDVARRRVLVSEQLEEQIARWRPRSLKGDKDAALALARFLDRYAKLYGLDAPSRSEVSGKDGAPIVFDLTGMSSEQLSQLASGLAEDDAADEGGSPAADPGGARAAKAGRGEAT